MAISADGRFSVTVQDRARMHALLIRQKGSIADSGAVHRYLVAVTGAAGLRDVCSVNRGSWIAGRQDRRHVTAFRMAIETTGGLTPLLDASGVKTVLIRLVSLDVKIILSEVREVISISVTPAAVKTRLV